MGFEKILPISDVKDCFHQDMLHERLTHLDIDFYKNFPHHNGVSDLCNLTDREAVLHFINRGYIEGRTYNRWFHYFIDPKFYLNEYADIGLKNFGDALRHWFYYGVFENKIPNTVTNDIINSDIHLFQMGRVGSKSIESSIKNSGYNKLIPHFHWVSEFPVAYPDCFYSYKDILTKFNKKRIIISGVREPLSRVISGYYMSSLDNKSSINEAKINFMIENDFESFVNLLEESLYQILNWFHHNYYMDINVYNYDFDIVKGYTIIEKGNTIVFLYSLNKLGDIWDKLSEMLNLTLIGEEINKSQDNIFNIKKNFNEKLVKHIKTIIINSDYYKHFFGSNYEW